MTSSDLFRQKANECRRLAATARNRSDKAFWLGLVERWKVVESQSARQRCLQQAPLGVQVGVGNLNPLKTRSPRKGGRVSGADPAQPKRVSAA
jgi:hypothetical protein